MRKARREHRRALWWHTAPRRPRFDALARDLEVDVAVIGGGLTGLTAGLHLARRGVRVAVLEADEMGSGASGVNAGFVVPHFAKAGPAAVRSRFGDDAGGRLLDLVGRGADRVFATVREHAIACDAAQTGWLQPACTEKVNRVLQHDVDAWRALGRPVTHLDAEATARLTGVRGYKGALLDPTGGTLHPLRYVYGLADAVRRAGTEIYESTEALAVERVGTAWHVRCKGGTARADRVLLCTNAAEGGVASQMSWRIIPLTVHQIATRPLPRDVVDKVSPGRHPVSDARAFPFTYRLDRDDRMISGGVAMLPIAADRRMARAIVRRLAAELHLPEVPEVEHVWSGTAAMTLDLLPRLFELGPGYIGGIGCNGRGVALTAMLGEVLAEAAVGTPLADLPIPVAAARSAPLRVLRRAAPAAAVALAKLKDRLAGN